MGVIWKVITIIIDKRMADSIEFHDILNGFIAQRGTDKSTLKAELLQKIMVLRQELLYNIFVDIHKSYDAMDWGRTLAILEGYGVVPRF